MTLGARIRQRREHLGFTQFSLARSLDVDQSTIAKWESGPNRPRTSSLEKLAVLLGVSVAWLVAGDDAYKTPAQSVGPRPGRDLPVLNVEPSPTELGLKIAGEPQQYLERPPSLAGVSNAYAIFVYDDRMEPRYSPGDVIYVNPNRPVTPGSYVVVLQEGSSVGIGRLVERSDSVIAIEQLFPARTVRLPKPTVRKLHRIVLAGEP